MSCHGASFDFEEVRLDSRDLKVGRASAAFQRLG